MLSMIFMLILLASYFVHVARNNSHEIARWVLIQSYWFHGKEYKESESYDEWKNQEMYDDVRY